MPSTRLVMGAIRWPLLGKIEVVSMGIYSTLAHRNSCVGYNLLPFVRNGVIIASGIIGVLMMWNPSVVTLSSLPPSALNVTGQATSAEVSLESLDRDLLQPAALWHAPFPPPPPPLRELRLATLRNSLGSHSGDYIFWLIRVWWSTWLVLIGYALVALGLL